MPYRHHIGNPLPKVSPDGCVTPIHQQGVRPFQFWCYHALPMTFDDSLSYYELLCRLSNYVNKLSENDSTLVDLYERLRCWCETAMSQQNLSYLMELELDRMAEDGSLNTALMNYVEPGSGIKINTDTIEVEYPEDRRPNPCGCTHIVTSDTESAESAYEGIVVTDVSCEECPDKTRCQCDFCMLPHTHTVMRANFQLDMEAGTGVELTPTPSTASGTVNVHSLIRGGSGVTVDPSSGTNHSEQVIRTNVTAGTGITIDPSSSNTETAQNIRSNVVAGSGISISPSSGSSNSAQTYSLNATGGDGVDIDKNSDGSVTFNLQLGEVVDAGSGITVTEHDSGHVNIATNLLGGTGITLSPKSSTQSGQQRIDTDFNSGIGVEIVNETDGSQTFQTKFKSGTGISISDNEGDKSQTFATNLKAGTGVTITNGSDGSQTISANLTGGDGVEIDGNEIDLKLGEVVENGSGITVTDLGNGHVNVATNLEAGDGIVISPSSSTTSGKQTISASITGGNSSGSIRAGSGIQVVQQSSGVVRVQSWLKGGDGIVISPESGSNNAEQNIAMNVTSGGTVTTQFIDGQLFIYGAPDSSSSALYSISLDNSEIKQLHVYDYYSEANELASDADSIVNDIMGRFNDEATYGQYNMFVLMWKNWYYGSQYCSSPSGDSDYPNTSPIVRIQRTVINDNLLSASLHISSNTTNQRYLTGKFNEIETGNWYFHTNTWDSDVYKGSRIMSFWFPKWSPYVNMLDNDLSMSQESTDGLWNISPQSYPLSFSHSYGAVRRTVANGRYATIATATSSDGFNMQPSDAWNFYNVSQYQNHMLPYYCHLGFTLTFT